MAQVPLILQRILGRNGADPPHTLPPDMATEATNVDFFEGGLGRKRAGTTGVTLNGFTASGSVTQLARYLPSDNEAAAQLIAVDSNDGATVQFLSAGTTWAKYTLADAMTAFVDVSMVNFNGKLYMAYDSAVNRMHVIPSAGGTPRRMGFTIPAVPTGFSVAGGSVTDIRKYALCWTEQVSSVTVRRSNLSVLSAAQTLAAQDETVTRTTPPGDGETHWELYAFSDDDNYAIGYRIATTVIATTTAVDNKATLAGQGFSAPPDTGANTPAPSAKYLLTDGSHLLGAGAWESAAGDSITPSVRMVWWTPALGSTVDQGDDDHILNTAAIKTYAFVDEALTGIGGPINGNIFLFSFRRMWRMVPTGQVDAAYEIQAIREGVGCIRHGTICVGEDEEGRQALYWLSPNGPYRVGADGVQYIGRDMEDRWAAVNLNAATIVGWSVFIPDLHQVWFFVASAGLSNPSEKFVFDCRLGRFLELEGVRGVRYGWSRATGDAAKSFPGCLFSNTLGASMTKDLKLYTGMQANSPTIIKHQTGTDDAGTTFAATVKSKAFNIQPGANVGMLADAYLLAKAATGVTITLTIDRDNGLETPTSTALLTAAGSETYVAPKFEGAAISQAGRLQFQLGDGSAVSNGWTLTEFSTPLTTEGTR